MTRIFRTLLIAAASAIMPTGESIDVTGYEYEQDSEGVVTLLDAPIDENGEVTFPNVEEK